MTEDTELILNAYSFIRGRLGLLFTSNKMEGKPGFSSPRDVPRAIVSAANRPICQPLLWINSLKKGKVFKPDLTDIYSS